MGCPREQNWHHRIVHVMTLGFNRIRSDRKNRFREITLRVMPIWWGLTLVIYHALAGFVLTRERLRFFSSSSPLLLFKQPRLSFTFVLSPIPSPVTIFWTCLWQVLRIGAQFQKRAFKTVLRCYSPGSFEFGPVVYWRQGKKNGESLFLCPSHVFTFGSNSQCLLPRSGLNVNLEYRDRSCRFSLN